MICFVRSNLAKSGICSDVIKLGCTNRALICSPDGCKKPFVSWSPA